MSTWGISGPQFLLLYLVLFAVTVLGVVLARRRALASDGAARVVAGSANGRPVGLLVGFLLVTVVVAAALAGRVPNATELGRRTLQTLRAEHPRPGSGASPAQLSMATALFGAGVLWAADTDIAMMLRVPREQGFSAGFGGDGGGDGGGGGCGGGGCGGGGCGG